MGKWISDVQFYFGSNKTIDLLIDSNNIRNYYIGSGVEIIQPHVIVEGSKVVKNSKI